MAATPCQRSIFGWELFQALVGLLVWIGAASDPNRRPSVGRRKGSIFGSRDTDWLSDVILEGSLFGAGVLTLSAIRYDAALSSTGRVGIAIGARALRSREPIKGLPNFRAGAQLCLAG